MLAVLALLIRTILLVMFSLPIQILLTYLQYFIGVITYLQFEKLKLFAIDLLLYPSFWFIELLFVLDFLLKVCGFSNGVPFIELQIKQNKYQLHQKCLPIFNIDACVIQIFLQPNMLCSLNELFINTSWPARLRSETRVNEIVSLE